MTTADRNRFRLALAVWVAAFLAALALKYAGVIGPPVEALGLSFVLGLAAVYAFFRAS